MSDDQMKPEWKSITQGEMTGLTMERLEIPEGWLYRQRHLKVVQAMVFVPRPQEQLEVRIGDFVVSGTPEAVRAELDRHDETDEIVEALVTSGTKRLAGGGQVDFFAKFGEQQTRQTRRAEAHYTLGLGLLAQGRTQEAGNQFAQAINFNAGDTWAKYWLAHLNDED